MSNWLIFIGVFILFSCKNETSYTPKNSIEIYIPSPLNSEKLDSMTLWVSGIKDGDSFVGINKNHEEIEVRMIFIDAPEKFQPYSIISKQFAADLLFQDSVKILYHSKDKYDRILGLVINSEGLVVNEELLKNGMAWHFKQYSNDKKYSHWEDSARTHQLGLFTASEPVPPWEWRHSKN